MKQSTVAACLNQRSIKGRKFEYLDCIFEKGLLLAKSLSTDKSRGLKHVAGGPHAAHMMHLWGLHTSQRLTKL
jgi:hypothetical protein